MDTRVVKSLMLFHDISDINLQKLLTLLRQKQMILSSRGHHEKANTVGNDITQGVMLRNKNKVSIANSFLANVVYSDVDFYIVNNMLTKEGAQYLNEYMKKNTLSITQPISKL
jgi:hypothetical protein